MMSSISRETFPARFSASHRYIPSSSAFKWMVSTDLSSDIVRCLLFAIGIISWLFLNHLMVVGFGMPENLHSNLALSFNLYFLDRSTFDDTLVGSVGSITCNSRDLFTKLLLPKNAARQTYRPAASLSIGLKWSSL